MHALAAHSASCSSLRVFTCALLASLQNMGMEKQMQMHACVFERLRTRPHGHVKCLVCIASMPLAINVVIKQGNFADAVVMHASMTACMHTLLHASEHGCMQEMAVTCMNVPASDIQEMCACLLSHTGGACVRCTTKSNCFGHERANSRYHT